MPEQPPQSNRKDEFLETIKDLITGGHAFNIAGIGYDDLETALEEGVIIQHMKTLKVEGVFSPVGMVGYQFVRVIPRFDKIYPDNSKPEFAGEDKRPNRKGEFDGSHY